MEFKYLGLNKFTFEKLIIKCSKKILSLKFICCSHEKFDAFLKIKNINLRFTRNESGWNQNKPFV